LGFPKAGIGYIEYIWVDKVAQALVVVEAGAIDTGIDCSDAAAKRIDPRDCGQYIVPNVIPEYRVLA